MALREIVSNFKNKVVQSAAAAKARVASIRAANLARPNRIVTGTLPIGAGGALGAVGRGARYVGSATKTIAMRALGNPLAGAGFREGMKKFATARFGGALGAATFLTAVDVAAKDAVSFKDIARTTVAAALNPIGAIIGTGIRGAKGAYGIVQDAREMLPPVNPDWMPPFVQPSYNFEQAPINITFPEPVSAPSTPSGFASFAPSMSVGDGGGSVLPVALLATLLAGGAGYAIGRRKKKKKKGKKYKQKSRKK